MELVCVLSADKWRMTDDRTGEIREGVSIYYVNDYRDETEHSVGFRPTKAPASEAAFAQISEGGAPWLVRAADRQQARQGRCSNPTGNRRATRRAPRPVPQGIAGAAHRERCPAPSTATRCGTWRLEIDRGEAYRPRAKVQEPERKARPMLNRLPRQMPPLSTMLSDIGNPTPKGSRSRTPRQRANGAALAAGRLRTPPGASSAVLAHPGGV